MIRMYKRDKFELLKPLVKQLTAKYLLTRRYIDVEKYVLKQPIPVSFYKKELVSLYYSKVPFYDLPRDYTLHPVQNISNYAIEIKKANVIGASNLIILSKKYVLYDLKFWDKNNSIDHSDEAIKYQKNNFCVLDNIISDDFFSEAIVLCGNYSSNYYHFLIEIISKFQLLNQLNICKNIPLLVDFVCLKQPNYRQLINYFNIHERKILSVEKNKIYSIGKLYHISCPNIIPPNYFKICSIKASDNLFNLSSLAYLRDRLLKIKGKVGTSKKVFISRKNSGRRRTYNEEEVSVLLQKFGFEMLCPEDYTISEQVYIFNNADFIIGATGAAFTNLLFCNKTCKAICLTNFPIQVSIFSTIALFVGLDLTYLYDKTLVLEETSDLHTAFKIDLNTLENLIEQKL